MLNMTERSDRVRGGLEGLLIGDAFGVPYEFHGPEQLPPIHRLAFEPPADFARAHVMVPPGTWSDDGAQALCLLDSLLSCGALDVDDLGRRFVRWYQDGYLAVDGLVFDVGIGTLQALKAIAAGVDTLSAARTDENANGNGALMRVLPLALWHRGTDEELVRDAHLQTRVTHGHERSQVCSALYCLWAQREKRGDGEAYADAVKVLRVLYAGEPTLLAELEEEVRPDEPPAGRGSGYVVDCLHSARLALADAGSYEEVIRRAVALGHDTDTTAAVAGGIAGVRFGLRGIPSTWREALRGRDLLAPLLAALDDRPL
jgi:ADP-ribosylglycohydrolase